MAAKEEDLSDVPRCSHYQRRCCFVTPCCQKKYVCRICHDEREVHEVDRYSISELVCMQCKLRQKVSSRCNNCRISFGQYSCLICRMFDDRDRKQFHCEFCNLCRIGGKENFFHCMKCNMCLARNIQESHKCIENISKSGCPVCLEDMHTSTTALFVPNCGHMMHQKCYGSMRKAGMLACPVCCTSFEDAERIWKQLDEIASRTRLEEAFQNMKFKILCRDCHKESEAQYNMVGIKCNQCGSYNTCQS